MTRYLVYDVYRKGAAGLSNLVMSVELGVVLAALTDRVLVLRGNQSPCANVVQYGDAVPNTYPSRVTDVFDLGVPWINADRLELSNFALHDICDKPAWECAFHFPRELDTRTADARSFAGRRSDWITAADDLAHIPALSFTGGPDSNTLSFHSYFFYLGRDAQYLAYDALRKTQPKPEYVALANRIAADLGSFNAVHIRRGDFKKTIGTTTLIRTPAEALAALEPHFSRQDRLVIVTDDMDDPFFAPIAAAYPDHVFMDRFVLDGYRQEFLELPYHDSIALALLSQLIASQSADFIGTMTSTYTGLIQRMRGQSGRNEPFKFLWNELPAPGDDLKPGEHRVSDCIRLEKGIMVPEREGPYSWNRYDPRLNAAWMREWPEGFLVEEEMMARARLRSFVTPESEPVETPEAKDTTDHTGTADHRFMIAFMDTVLAASSNDETTAISMRSIFEPMFTEKATAASGEVRLIVEENGAWLGVDGKSKPVSPQPAVHLRTFYRQVVCEFIDRYPGLVWLHAGSASNESGAVVLPGEWARGKSSLVLELVKRGWHFLSDDISPLDTASRTVLPFPCTPQMRVGVSRELSRGQIGGAPKRAEPVAAAKIVQERQPVGLIVFPRFDGGTATQIHPVSAGQAVGKLIENCLSIVKNAESTIAQLCTMMEAVPAYDLVFADASAGADLILQVAKSSRRGREASWDDIGRQHEYRDR